MVTFGHWYAHNTILLFSVPHIFSLTGPKCGVRHHRTWHDDVIEWKHFPRYWPFVRGIDRSPVNSPYKGQWRGALMFSLICVWIHRLSKQSWGWWFETLSRPLWRHSNDHVVWTCSLWHILRLHCICWRLGSPLLTWFNFNPSIDK